MRSFDGQERRRRLARRHGLSARLPTVEQVAGAMVVLHATDPATVYLSALARLDRPDLAAVDDALYHDRTVARVLAMRRTLFVVPVANLAAVERSSAPAVAAVERRKLLGYLADSGVADPEGWLAGAGAEVEAVLDELAATGAGATARQITALVPRLATRLTLGAGSRNEISAGATSRVLGVLAVEGRLMRGRPTGNWTTRQYTWHLRRHWLAPADGDVGGAARGTAGGSGGGAGRGGVSGADGVAGEGVVDPGVASGDLVRRWLYTFGPAPFDDLTWWTGWTVRQLRDALGRLDVVEVDLDGAVGLALADDLDPEPDPGPWVALLPALDPTPMGWKHRDWYLGPHRAPLFDRSGNIGPTVWADGRIVGGWGQRPDGSVAVRLLEDVGSDHRSLIQAESDRLGTILAGTVVKPSFPTPLQKELASS